MKYIVAIWTACIFCSCMSESSMTDKINHVVDSLIISGSLSGHVVSVFKEDKGQYDLYTISNTIGVVYDEVGNVVISGTRSYNGITILFYFPADNITNTDQDKLERTIKDDSGTHHVKLWYYAVCKEYHKELLVEAKNPGIASYEIPAIRDFACAYSLLPSSNEVIIYSVTVVENDTLNKTDFDMLAKVYNRTGDTLYNKLRSPNFAFIQLADTVICNVKRLPLHDKLIDDTLWVDDPDLIARYKLSFSINNKFIPFEPCTIQQMLEDSFCLIDTVNFYKEGEFKVFIPDKIDIYLQRNGEWLE